MPANRMHQYSPFTKPAKPVKKASLAIPPGFTVCPPQLVSLSAWQQEIYRAAYERARAAAQVPRFHRMLFSVWN